MTRSRLAAIAALSIPALLITTSVGEAQRDEQYRAGTTCKMRHTETRDKVKAKTEVSKLQRGPVRRGAAAAVVPAAGVKVIHKLKDLTDSNGNNVVDGKEVDRTNDDGIAKNTLELNNFGNYRLTTKVKVDGEVVAENTILFGVSDRVSGECDPPLGAGEA